MAEEKDPEDFPQFATALIIAGLVWHIRNAPAGVQPASMDSSRSVSQSTAA